MKQTFKVKGMHCASCEMLIKDSLEELGLNPEVSATAGTVVVDLQGSVSEADVIKAIQAEGFKVE